MAEYEWVRSSEITFLQYMQMCHRHAQELIDGATTREVYDDSEGHINVVRKGDDLGMILTEYYADGENPVDHVLYSFPFTDDLIILRSCLASEYAYTYSKYAGNLGIRMRHFVFPSDLLQVPDDPPKGKGLTEEDIDKAFEDVAVGGRKAEGHGGAE
jgi:hypothetical protein